MDETNTEIEKQKEDATIENVPEDLLKTHYFGCGPCHPKWLHFLFARKKFFTFLLSVFGFLEAGIVSGLISVVISTIEKRYNFGSLAAGFIAIVYDGTVLIGVIFISHFGSKAHRPRLLGCAALLMSFGAALFAMPQFFFGRYVPVDGDLLQEECLDERSFNLTKICDSSNHAAYAIFLVSSAIIGIAATPISTLGTAYIDEIVFPRYISLHIGAYGMLFVIGPLVGYAIGSGFLSLYVDLWLPTTLTPVDPAWVGAWWIPFLLFAVLLILLSMMFLMFPRYLPDSYLVQQERAKEMAKIYPSKYANEDSLTITAKMFPVHIKRLLCNPSFMLMSLGFSASYLFLEGFILFAPKFVEIQYKLTAFIAGIVVGAIAIPGGVLGTLVGALIVYGCKLKGKINALIVAINTLIIIPILLIFLLHCPQQKVVGITTPYTNDGAEAIHSSLLSESSCAQSCNCTSSIFEPVCGADNQTYFSACRGGCMKGPIGSALFENCTCIAESLYNNSLSHVDATADNGYCYDECIILAPALIGWTIMTFVAFVSQIPFIHFSLRVVADDQRALALGVQSAMFRLLGAIPGPLIFGALFDYACLSWQVECGQRGNCWLYNSDQLSYSAIGVGIPCNIIACICFFLAWLTFPKKKPRYSKETDEKQKEEETENIETEMF